MGFGCEPGFFLESVEIEVEKNKKDVPKDEIKSIVMDFWATHKNNEIVNNFFENEDEIEAFLEGDFTLPNNFSVEIGLTFALALSYYYPNYWFHYGLGDWVIFGINFSLKNGIMKAYSQDFGTKEYAIDNGWIDEDENPEELITFSELEYCDCWYTKKSWFQRDLSEYKKKVKKAFNL